MACTQRIIDKHGIQPICLPASASKRARANAFRNYRKQVVVPALSPKLHKSPLPWAWLAAHSQREFSQAAFETWWCLRVFGAAYPRRVCTSCSARLSRQHLEESCACFAIMCWTRGVRPEEVFLDPTSEQWFLATLSAIAEMASVTQLASRGRTGRLADSGAGAGCAAAR